MDETNPITQIDFMQTHIEALKEQLAEKEAMIDWLVAQLQDRCNNEYMCSFCRHRYRFAEYGKDKCHSNNWRKAAQAAAKKKV